MQLFLNRVEHGEVLTAAGLLDINKEFGLTVSVTIYHLLPGYEGDYYRYTNQMPSFPSIQLAGTQHVSISSSDTSIMETEVQLMLRSFCYSDKCFRKT